jgi:hypothetical protein
LDLALPIHLRDSDGTPRHDFVYHCDLAEFKPALYEEIAALYDFIPQDETDAIDPGEVKFFVAARPDDWGFLVVPLAHSEETLLLGRAQEYTLEDSEWETDYFDGMK